MIFSEPQKQCLCCSCIKYAGSTLLICSLYFDYLCGFLEWSLPFCVANKKLLWWGVRTTYIYRYEHKYNVNNFNVFWQMSVVDSLLSPCPHQQWVFGGLLYQAWFLSCWVLGPIRELSVNSKIQSATIVSTEISSYAGHAVVHRHHIWVAILTTFLSSQLPYWILIVPQIILREETLR